ncbi:STAS domain-containing protein [Saccharothrix longispora]|uniref:Anti-anti-sigma factor n=1 Tax=Saccharothrix longispora TaxID=33920 RepID=A0ABU1PRP7_9PSEU|nr:STAS domain-containing protein [Saccharothrix longispora]MDR6593325.1 anti-anti-sigma factor [Saccharothrix longispora]
MHASTQDPAPPPFRLDVERLADAVLVTVVGELDQSTAPRLREALDAALGDRPGVVVVDLRGVALLASAGLAALIAAHDQALPDTALRVVAGDTTPSMRSVRLTGLDELLVVHPTLDHALAAS